MRSIAGLKIGALWLSIFRRLVPGGKKQYDRTGQSIEIVRAIK
jgi:hypothetical protein